MNHPSTATARIAGWLAWACLLVPTAGAQADQPRFYLSTDRVFAPSDERVAVRLEAKGLSHMDFRLYRIAKPEQFFLQQADLHRIEAQTGPKRASSLDVSAELWRLANRAALDTVRGQLSDRARSAGRTAFAEQVEALDSDARTVPPPALAVPLLRDFELVDMWREELEAGEEWIYREVALTARGSGVYLVEAVCGHEVGYTVLIVSRLTLLTRQSSDRLLVYAVDPDLGTPVADVQIELLRGKQALGAGTTGADGTWSKQIPLVRELTVLARKGDDFALLDPSYHPANLFSRKVYLTTERPVYRPAQTVFFKGVVRAYADERYELDELEKVTVRAIDPNGQPVHTQELSVSKTGSFHGQFQLFDSAALGTYRLIATADEKEYAGEFKVKAYRKPDYRVAVTPSSRAVVSGDRVQATISANYLFGPPVVGSKVKVKVVRTRFYIPWWIDADYSWYYSDNEYRNTSQETLEQFEGRLDAEGKFQIEFTTRPDSLDYTYGIEAVVTDVSEQAITGHAAVRVTKARFRLALEPEYLLNAPGGEVRVAVVTSDFARKAFAAQVDLQVIARQGADAASATETRVHAQKLQTGPEGRSWLTFRPERGGTYLVRATARDAAGNQVEAQATVYVTSSGGDLPIAPVEVEVIADRRSYHVGDKARFLLLVPHANAHLLVTVEGGNLYRHEVVRARGHSALFEVSIDQAQAPNFFLKVATVFQRSLYERRLDVVVPPRDKLLVVDVEADKAKAAPREKVTFTVRVRDHESKPVAGAEVALGLVDEAIYGISPEIAIPITKYFYHRKRNDVRSSCSLDFRFFGYGEGAKDRMAALHLRQPVVPGSFKAAASSQLRTTFQDTLAWQPVLTTDAQGLAKLTVDLPDNLTTWRGTARVITRDTRVGQGTGELLVTKPVVLRIAAPAFLVERDESKLGLLVHNYTGAQRTFRVALESGGGQLDLAGDAREVQVAANSVAVVAWQARALKAGTAQLRATASAEGFSDGLEQSLPIRPYGIEQVLLAGGVLDDQNPTASVLLEVPAQVAADSVRASLNASSGVAPALLASLEYLAGYPYGCTEQTMSRFLPDLVVARALQDLGMKNDRLEEQLPGFIRAGLARLAQLQHSDGGWGWWEEDATDAFMTAYVVQGLGMAQRLGWKTGSDVLERGTNRLKVLVRDARLSATQRSYLLYSLALARVKYESMLSKLHDQRADLTEYGKALLSMALFEMGQTERAAELAGQIDLVAHTSNQGSWWGDRTERPGWEADPIETTAAVLRSLLLSNPKSVHIPAAVRWLMSVRDGDHWQSTRDTAMAIFALVDYLKQAGKATYQADIETSLNGAALAPVAFGPQDVFKRSVEVFEQRPGRPGANRIELNRKGSGALFYNASVRFFGREDPIPARGQAFGVTRRMFLVERQPQADSWKLTTRPLAGPVHSGQEILVVLELHAAQDADYILVEDPLAAGVQPILHDRGYRLPGVELVQPRMHREFHDQHAAFFLSSLRKGNRQLAYLVRATLPGDYHVLPARISPMYDPQFAGNSASDMLRVED
jgi:uncharacterized protein YfaS (alpha-2-macroglobulin family)